MADEPDKMREIERLVRVPSVLDGRAGYDIAPDGRTAAVAWNKSGQWELYLVDLDGDRAPRRITSADVPEGKVAPHWSPDRRCLAYAQDHDGDGRVLFTYSGPGHPPDLWIAELDGAQPRYRQLTRSLPEELADYKFEAPIHIGYSSLEDRALVRALLLCRASRLVVRSGL